MSGAVASRPELLSGALEALQHLPAGGDPLAALRRAAAARWEASGVPAARAEAWRFTDLAPLRRDGWRPADEAAAKALPVDSRALLPEVTGDATRLVFVNGWLREDLSTRRPLPDGVVLSSLATAPPQQLAALLGGRRERLGIPAAVSPFVDLSTALFCDGALLHLPRGVALAAPIYLLFLSAAGDAPTAVHPRVLVVAEPESAASVVEVHLTPAGGAAAHPTFTNAVVEASLGAGARLDWTQVLEPQPRGAHLGELFVHQDRDSRFGLATVQRGGPLVRNDASVVLDGEGAECVLRGLTLAREGELVDNHTWVDHARAHCRSEQVYKGVVAGRSRGVFDGQILVREGSQKTSAHQQTRNLLLSDEAVVHANPRLQILADDVRCTHGATLGQLDREALFYLRSRGLPEARAREVMTYAFVAGQLDAIEPEPLRTWLAGSVREGLPAAEGAE